MLRRNYLCAVDIGSSKISACAVKLVKGKPDNFYFETVPSRWVSEGVVTDSIELVSCLGRLILSLRQASGLNIKFISANISGKDISTKYSRAIIPLAERGNKVITASDIQRANEQARILGSSLEEEIIQVIPVSYTIDSKGNIINPLGLYSHRLEADIYLIMAKSSSVQSLTRVISQCGLELEGLFFSGLATSAVVFDNEARDAVNILCDIGSDTTELLFFRNSRLYEVNILKLGGDDFTSSLKEELSLPFELAEDIKKSAGQVGEIDRLSEDREILVRKDNLYKPIKQKQVSSILTRQAKLIAAQIKDLVTKRVSLYEVKNFILTGRAILLEGFIEVLENELSVPVRIGRVNDPFISGLINEYPQLSGSRYLNFITSLGMLAQLLKEKPRKFFSSEITGRNAFVRTFNRVKEVYQEYF
jgi:cell division protein FtsA